MDSLLLTIAVRIALCSALTWAVWSKFGLVGLVVCLPLFGGSLARPLIDLFATSAQGARKVALRKVEGRHYAFRGLAIDILDDIDHHRWLRVADLRKVIPGLPADRVLQTLYPEGVQVVQPSPAVRMRATELLDYLGKSTEPQSLKFRHWVEREVDYPSRRKRPRSAGSLPPDDPAP